MATYGCAASVADTLLEHIQKRCTQHTNPFWFTWWHGCVYKTRCSAHTHKASGLIYSLHSSVLYIISRLPLSSGENVLKSNRVIWCSFRIHAVPHNSFHSKSRCKFVCIYLSAVVDVVARSIHPSVRLHWDFPFENDAKEEKERQPVTSTRKREKCEKRREWRGTGASSAFNFP